MITIFVVATLIGFINASTLTTPPLSALVVGFENSYDLSLFANTLTDQGIDATLILSSHAGEIYENLIDLEVIRLNVSIEDGGNAEKKALRACETLLEDQKILKRIGEIQPTFVIFPGLRHDACLLPWTKFIGSIPVIWTLGIDDEHYTIEKTRMGLPIHTGSIIERFWANINLRSVISHADANFVTPGIKIAKKYITNFNEDTLDKLYSDVEIVLWGADRILRVNFAALTHRFVEVGCYHCRGVQPLPPDLQKGLVEYRLGTIAVTLDESHTDLITSIAEKLPQGRQGQAVAWKNKNVRFVDKKPENLFVHPRVDRQDLIGYPRTRVYLSHCDDTEFLEAGFHGTPIICFPRNTHEKENAQRAIDLGFSLSLNDDYSIDKVIKLIVEIHESAVYRENARIVSLSLRDRPMPTADSLIFWLRYIERNSKNSIEYSPLDKKIQIRTFSEDVQLYIGILIGTVFGTLFATTTALTWYFQGRMSKSIKSKGKKYSR